MPGTLVVDFLGATGTVAYFDDFDIITGFDPVFSGIYLTITDGGTLDLRGSLDPNYYTYATIESASAQDLTVQTGAGTTRFFGGDGTDRFFGGDDYDNFITSRGDDRFFGEGGDDSVNFDFAGTNLFDGGSGTDIVIMNHMTVARLVGTAEAFSVISTSGDVLHVLNAEQFQGGGLTHFWVSTGSLAFEAGVTVQGTQGADVISLFSAPAGQGVATLGDDRLLGGGGADDIRGSWGDDQIAGGLGADRLVGNAGADAFVFDAAGWTGGDADRILGFESGSDAIWFDDAVFATLASQTDGAVAAGSLHLGTRAAEADDCLIYDQASGRLWYDADGSGRGLQALVAKLGGGTVLAESDLMVV